MSEHMWYIAGTIIGIWLGVWFCAFMIPKIENLIEKKKPKKEERIRIALDESIGFKKTDQLKRLGYEIVCIAGHAEKDVSWLNRAFANGALFVISPDLDIPNYIERESYPMIWIDYLHVPMAKGGKNWADYVDSRIKFKLRFLKEQFGGIN